MSWTVESAVMGGCDCMYSNIRTECSFSLTLVCVDLISLGGGYEKLVRHYTTRKQSRTESVIGDLDICCLATAQPPRLWGFCNSPSAVGQI